MPRFNVGDRVVIARSYNQSDRYMCCIGRAGVVSFVTQGGRCFVDSTGDCMWYEHELMPFGAGAEYFGAIMGSYNIVDGFKIGDKVIIANSISDDPRYKNLIGTTATIVDRIPADAIVLSNSLHLHWAPSELMLTTNPLRFEFNNAEELL